MVELIIFMVSGLVCFLLGRASRYETNEKAYKRYIRTLEQENVKLKKELNELAKHRQIFIKQEIDSHFSN